MLSSSLSYLNRPSSSMMLLGDTMFGVRYMSSSSSDSSVRSSSSSSMSSKALRSLRASFIIASGIRGLSCPPTAILKKSLRSEMDRLCPSSGGIYETILVFDDILVDRYVNVESRRFYAVRE